jgi:hypothetical protein
MNSLWPQAGSLPGGGAVVGIIAQIGSVAIARQRRTAKSNRAF